MPPTAASGPGEVDPPQAPVSGSKHAATTSGPETLTTRRYADSIAMEILR
jgi:hypothetical protein